MIGLDSGFLIAWAIPEHAAHGACRLLAGDATRQGRTFGLTTGILAEFIHVVTDPRRFSQPLSMAHALSNAHFWSHAAEVSLLRQDATVTGTWLDWLTRHHLGRKRLLDTLIAATWHGAGITEIWTLNPDDFAIFGCFNLWSPMSV